MALAKGATVRLHGLQARSELNDRVGTIVLYDESKKRYAVKLDDVQAPILLKPANLQPVGIDDGGSSARRVRLQALTADAAAQHALKVEAAAYTETIHAAKSRAEVDDDTWDRVVEIQALVQRACNSCNVDFPALQLECLQVDDRACWSRTSVEYAHFLLGRLTAAVRRACQKPSASPSRVLKLHACGGANSDPSATPCSRRPYSRRKVRSRMRTPTRCCASLQTAARLSTVGPSGLTSRRATRCTASWRSRGTPRHTRGWMRRARRWPQRPPPAAAAAARVWELRVRMTRVWPQRGDPCSASCSGYRWHGRHMGRHPAHGLDAWYCCIWDESDDMMQIRVVVAHSCSIKYCSSALQAQSRFLLYRHRYCTQSYMIV